MVGIPFGSESIEVTPVALGCWPMTGMTSPDATRVDALETIRQARRSGINFFDTAYCYGLHGESESMLGEVLQGERQQVFLATKGGIHWDSQGKRQLDARPKRLITQCEASLRRLRTDYVDLLYLHAPDPATPLEESADALRRLKDSGKCRAVGVSNVSLDQLRTFHSACPVDAVQPPFNMLQRDIEQDLLPWCRERRIAVVVYWPLLKGLLAGKLPRDHQFAPGDGRAKYPMFQGDQWRRNQDLVEDLRRIAQRIGATVAQLVVAWTITRPGITAALCGAKRPEQIAETAAAMQVPIDAETGQQIQEALQRRGKAVTTGAV